MKKIFIHYLLIFVALSSASCSKHGVTPTKIKLSVGHIIANMENGIGAGGGILFGKSDTGAVFGKVITGADESIELANGGWIFQAILWDPGESRAMSGNVYCGKVAQKLSGANASISMDLNNANCTDGDFSGGQSYVNAANGKVRFSDFFVEECDDLSKSLGYTCGAGNQGSALSYRVVFRNYSRNPGTPLSSDGGTLVSGCQKINRADPQDLLHLGMALNIPSGSKSNPFVVTLEMFVGNETCSPDAKGVHMIVLDQGVNGQSSAPEKILYSSNQCSTGAAAFTGSLTEIKNKCDNIFGTFSGSTCSLNDIPATISRFMTGSDCFSNTPANPAIKHFVSIPKGFICDRYEGLSQALGAHPFAGGNGTPERPYKICNEWQMNQIGEVGAPESYRSSSYKLMNDLDMNKADFVATYAKPICAKDGSILDKHHNLNSLDRIANANCAAEAIVGFSGNFNGNGQTIKNARISSEATPSLGFVRKLINGTITNLIFKNLEVHGASQVGGLAGEMHNSLIKNIVINNLNVESKGVAGGIASVVYNIGSMIDNVHIDDARIRGMNFIGGLVGDNEGQISTSHFRGSIDNYKQSNGIGGLVGRSSTATSSLSNSFSEGSIYSSGTYTAGIVAINNGVVDNVYSTMTIISSFNLSGNYLGGIVGDNKTSSNLSNVIFDGVLRADGASPHIDGVFAYGSGAHSNCFATKFSTSYSGCTLVTYADLRNVQYLVTNPNWLQAVGSIPRLSWENRECLQAINQNTIDVQVATSARGTFANPIIICTSAQLSTLGSRPSNEYYRIAEDINLSSFVDGSLISNFNGKLFGNGNIFYGLSLSLGSNTTIYEGIFRSISTNASIRNLKFYGNKLIDSVTDNGTAIVVGMNNGTIENIDLFGNIVQSNNYAGIVAGRNYNKIIGISTKNDNVKGDMYIGGIVGSAEAGSSILRVDSNVALSNNNTNYSYIGGISGQNLGSIDQARFNGNFNFNNVSGASYALLGGLTGYNNATISNSMVDKNAILRVKNFSKVGGLIGENGAAGFIKSSFNIGKLIFDNGVEATVSMPFNPLIGYNGGAINPNVYFLENTIGSSLFSTTTTAVCGGTGTFTCPTTDNSPSTADLFFTESDIFGGDLSGMIPFTGQSTSVLSYVGLISLPTSTSLTFIKSYTVPDVSRKRSIASFGAVSSFCSGWSGANGSDKCSNLNDEYDIANFESTGVTGYGQNRLYAYYMSSMNNLPAPPEAPIWELDVHDGYPKLLQLKNH